MVTHRREFSAPVLKELHQNCYYNPYEDNNPVVPVPLMDRKASMRDTNWYVVTGAPCSGKSSVIRELEALGYRVVHEVARALIDSLLQKGIRLEEIKADTLGFERRILAAKTEIEMNLAPEEVVFLDRAVPDSIAYYTAEGLDPADPLKTSRRFRYRKVFLFERLRFEGDRVRSENDLKAAGIEVLIQQSYEDLGYELVRVPIMALQRRTQFVLGHVSIP